MSDFFSDYKKLISCIDNMTKNAEGGSAKFTYRYVELTPLLEEVMPKIHENNFILLQTVRSGSGNLEREYNGNKMTLPCYELHSELIHTSGEKIECDLPLLVDDIDPQSFGSAETYMRRYSIYALLHIKTEDDDGAGASAKAKSKYKEPQTFEDFVFAIVDCNVEKGVSALWYKWKEKFTNTSQEYKDLIQLSSNRKLQLNNPNLQILIYDKCSDKVKTILEDKQ